MDVDAAGGSAASGSGAGARPAAARGEAATALPAGPVVTDMDALLHVVHCVFLGHGFRRAGESGGGSTDHLRPIRVPYQHDSRPPISAVYVPVLRHLVVYAAIEGSTDVPGRVTVQLGMNTASIQAKVDYLLVYPIITRQCIPVLPALPPEVCFGLLGCLAIPALGRIGCTSKAFSA